MEEEHLSQLESKNPEKIKTILDEFNDKNAQLFSFTKFHENDKWHKLWLAVFAILKDDALAELHPLCLNTIRILTRDEVSLKKHNIINDLNCLLELAHLTLSKDTSVEQAPASADAAEAAQPDVASCHTETVVETLKCLCNLVFQNADCRRECVRCNVMDAILKRMCSATVYPTSVELFDMKLFFLLTALEPSARNRVQIDSNGIAYMTEWLDERLGEAQHTDEQLDVLCEVLKVMFNITTSPDKSPSESEIQYLHLTGVIRRLLLRFGAMSNEHERNVIVHSINLLTNMSSASLLELMVKCEPAEAEAPSSAQLLIFEGWNVRALEIMLRYLHSLLDEATSNDMLPPVLTVMVKCARCHRIMRRYIRSVVLPPLRDVSKRPEEGHELRNHLCRFLTLPSMVVRDLAADLLFVCCKENVPRMIKYTGYGNAAGLFAKRGLLDCRRVENVEYSSDSEDSDTEEYKQVAHGINPVLGCYEAPKRSPLEGMSEEQKEYEAVQLANLMDKLHRGGIVQPCRIGEDGKPQPVDHILQLQEELPQQQYDQKQKS